MLDEIVNNNDNNNNVQLDCNREFLPSKNCDINITCITNCLSQNSVSIESINNIQTSNQFSFSTKVERQNSTSNNMNSATTDFPNNEDNPSKSSWSEMDVNRRYNPISFCKRGLHVASLNIQHLLPKLDELKFHLYDKAGPDIVGLYETFLNRDINDSVLIIDTFNIERKDRVGKNGGGVLVYISNKVPYKRRHDLEDDDIESICIEITYPNKRPFILSFIYRPPCSNQKLDKYI